MLIGVWIGNLDEFPVATYFGNNIEHSVIPGLARIHERLLCQVRFDEIFPPVFAELLLQV